MAENLLHFGAVRYRVSGNGELKHELITYDDQVIKELLPLTLNATPGKEPTRISNLITQRTRLKVYTTEFDDDVKINRIILFARETYSGYPM
jgi:hypothetical protein